MNILIIEDNARIIDNLSYILENENYKVDIAESGDSGYTKAINENYDLIVLDLMLPGMSGFEILEALQSNNIATPVLVLSAKNQIEDKVKALDLGSYDYLSKPFAPEELLARIRGILRRKYNIVSNIIAIGEIIFDTNKKEVKVNGRILDLTQKEYEIFEFLSYNKYKVISRITLGEHIWGESLDLFTMSNFIDVHLKNLRKKIALYSDRKYIYTKRGMGFIFTDKDEE
jgi:DNA-binding response OmpR family regulator